MSRSPTSPPAWTFIDAVAESDEPPHAYARWLAQPSASSDDYLFSASTVRFGARDADRLVAPPDLEVVSQGSGVVLCSKRLGGSLQVPELSEPTARRLCARIDGEQSCARLRARAGGDALAFDVLLRAALGRVLFVPEAVTELEQRVSGTELVRFVGTPYEIERPYWENMSDVRSAAPAALQDVSDTAGFTRALRRLHVVALMGARLENFYRRASRIAGRKLQPGALYGAPSRTEETERGTLLLAGPRVGVPFVGGYNYQALVCAHDPEALEKTRSVRDAHGLDWGRVVFGRSPEETENRAWFLPPRPLREQHLERLYAGYSDAANAVNEPALLVRALARFHFRFVRLHPFRCANQSLSMNLVNLLLLRGTGASMPHSLLDQFALRLAEGAYEEVFARAVAHTSGSGAPPVRWANLRRQKSDVYSLIERLQNAANPSIARALCAASPAAARAALVAD